MKKKKALALAAAAALACCCAAGGSLAWLWDRTESPENEYTVGNIGIALEENTGDSYSMIPGCTIRKDPTVTVTAGSETCYLFVKVEKSEHFDDYMTCRMADGWTPLEENPDVYWQVAQTSSTDKSYPVLKDNTVTVRDTVTEAMMARAGKPTLTFTAYAVQYYNGGDADGETCFEPADAWEIVNPTAAPQPGLQQ